MIERNPTMVSFIIDNITVSDVRSKILRILVANQPYFPGAENGIDTSYNIKVIINGKIYEAIYRAKIRRSGILRLGAEIYNDILKIEPAEKLNVTVLEKNSLYEITSL